MSCGQAIDDLREEYKGMTDKIEKNGLGWKMWLGIGASFVYACGAVFILAMNLYYSPPSPPLGLNEIGDYLAGAFSPLAFLWLVIGYLMQNRELKTQINEFKNGLNISRGNLNLDIKTRLREEIINHNKAQPLFEFINEHNISNPSIKLFKIKNHKAIVSDVRVYDTDVISMIDKKHYIEKYVQIDKNKVTFHLPKSIEEYVDIPAYQQDKQQKSNFRNLTMFYYDENEVEQSILIKLIAIHSKNQPWRFKAEAESNRRDLYGELKALEN